MIVTMFQKLLKFNIYNIYMKHTTKRIMLLNYKHRFSKGMKSLKLWEDHNYQIV